MPPAAVSEVHRIRQLFPALDSDFVYFENAGGSQVPQVVIDAVSQYMREAYVQLGAPYPIAERATEAYDAAHRFANRFMNGEGVGDVVLGSSTSTLLRMLSDAYADVLSPGDEVIVMQGNHESCVGPWLRLESVGVQIRYWEIDRETQTFILEDLAKLLSPRTRLVAFSHVSNLLGEVHPIAEIVQMAHQAGAQAIVDGVAFAPHQAMDMKAWDADFYVFSAYKVYGPHISVLFGKAAAWNALTGPNHFFIDKSYFPAKFELGAASHEAAAGLRAVGGYLLQTMGLAPDRDPSRREIVEAWRVLSGFEAKPQAQLLSYLAEKSTVRIVGPRPGGAPRVPTISFLHHRLSPPEICARVAEVGIGIRYGSMYAYRLCKGLGIDPETGVVRVSLVHYNTEQEVERIIDVLDQTLD